MAGKKHRQRTGNKTFTSKGERRSSMSTRSNDPAQKMMNKMRALTKGKDVWFTIPNPNKNETNKPFIRKKVSGKDFLARRQGKL